MKWNRSPKGAWDDEAECGFEDRSASRIDCANTRKMRYFSQATASASSRTDAFTHVWVPECVEALYTPQRKRHLPALIDRNLRGMLASAPDATASMGSFAVDSAKVNDTEAVDLMPQFADTHLSPVWEQGRDYYIHNDIDTVEC